MSEAYYSSNNNIITNCDVYYNSYQGILLSSSSNNLISNCTAYNNIWGIELVSSSNNKIHYNNVYNNTDYGIYSYPDTNDATYNWWGSANGPYHPNTNPNGTGNQVSDNVLYNPWLIEPVAGVGWPPEEVKPSEIPWLCICILIPIIAVVVLVVAGTSIKRGKKGALHPKSRI